MTRSAAVLLALGFACLVYGAYQLAPAAGAIVAGVLLVAAGIGMLERGPRKAKKVAE